MPRAEIDQRFFDTPYYITPNDPVRQEAFAVIRVAMRRKALVALGPVVLSKRERVMALEPCDRGLIGTTLHYACEVRDLKDQTVRQCRQWRRILRLTPRQQVGLRGVAVVQRDDAL